MKKLSLILAAILVVMSFPMMLMSNAFAADVVVTYTKGGATATTTSIADAITNADNNTTIYLTADEYVLTARESWNICGKTLTLDLGGSTVKSSGNPSNHFSGNGRVINVGFDGSKHETEAADAGTVTVKNGTFENAAGGPMFQLYHFMTIIFGEGCVVDCHAAGQFGICVMQPNSKVVFGNGCVVKNTVATPFASVEEIAKTPMYDSWYPLVGQNGANTTITYEEGCYVESSGPAFKTTAAATSGTVVVNGGTIVSQYKNLFPTGNTNFSLTINGGHIYNAILCPASGNNVDGGTIGKTAFIINWIGSNCTLKFTGNPVFYTLNKQTVKQSFSVASGVLASDSIALDDLTVYALGDDPAYMSRLEGAQCRTTVDSLGLRFQSSFDKEVMDWIDRVAVEGSVKFGTLIAPYAYVQQTGGELTKKAFVNNGLDCLNVMGDKGVYVDTNGDVVVKAAIVNIKEANKSVDFVATAYIEWVDMAGNEHISYSNPTPTDADARNILEVANAALEDVKASPEGEYVNEVVIKGATVYARINQAQVNALLTIVG